MKPLCTSYKRYLSRSSSYSDHNNQHGGDNAVMRSRTVRERGWRQAVLCKWDGEDRREDSDSGRRSRGLVRWRLAQVLDVSQQSTYSILFHYRFPGIKTSPLSSIYICSTNNPCIVLENVLEDAWKSFRVEKT